VAELTDTDRRWCLIFAGMFAHLGLGWRLWKRRLGGAP